MPIKHELLFDFVRLCPCCRTFGILDDLIAVFILVNEIRVINAGLLNALSKLDAAALANGGGLPLRWDQLKGNLRLEVGDPTGSLQHRELKEPVSLVLRIKPLTITENAVVFVFIPALRMQCNIGWSSCHLYVPC